METEHTSMSTKWPFWNLFEIIVHREWTIKDLNNIFDQSVEKENKQKIKSDTEVR